MRHSQSLTLQSTAHKNKMQMSLELKAKTLRQARPFGMSVTPPCPPLLLMRTRVRIAVRCVTLVIRDVCSAIRRCMQLMHTRVLFAIRCVTLVRQHTSAACVSIRQHSLFDSRTCIVGRSLCPYADVC